MSITSLDLKTLNFGYRSGTFTPKQVIQELYDRCSTYTDNPIWITLLPLDQVLQAATALEQRGKTEDLQSMPLYGIPFAVKDNIDVAGLLTTVACPGFSYNPTQTATVVEKLLQAGALLIGKTNLDQFATGLVGTRSPYGECHNAFNPDYVSGGSSSGSALAVALGLVSFALGTDTAGSGRVPAAFNNIVGLKPARGLVSTTGVFPACRSLDCVSVFALTSADAYQVLECIQGFDPQDSYSRSHPRMISPTTNHFRFGVPAAEQLEFFGDKEYEKLFQQAIRAFEAIGGIPVEIDFSSFQKAAQLLYSGPWVVERALAMQDFLTQHPEALLPVTRQILQQSNQYQAVDVFQALHDLQGLQQKALTEWDKMEVLLLPTTGTIYTRSQVNADPIVLNTNLGYYTNFVNLLDLCAIALPAGFRADGLPFGITLMATAFQDQWLCRLGATYQQKLEILLGATGLTLPVEQLAIDADDREWVQVAVLGAHLSGMPLNYQLTERKARLVQTTRTAPFYQFFALKGTQPPKPGIVRIDPNQAKGYAIEVEVWEMHHSQFGSFVTAIPAPLGIGSLLLESGESVHGFICEPYALVDAIDISHYGGWRSFVAESSR